MTSGKGPRAPSSRQSYCRPHARVARASADHVLPPPATASLWSGTSAPVREGQGSASTISQVWRVR
eukprot:2181314-Prymnesium_polylepis.1